MDYDTILPLIWLGFSSSFIGTLPMGMLTLTILQLTLANRPKEAITFGLGVVTIELIQIWVTLMGMNVLLTMVQLSNVFSILSIPILIYLGVKNIIKEQYAEEIQLAAPNMFYQGIAWGSMNVIIYPFWLLWGNVFVQRGWLTPTPITYFYFSFAAAMGTLGAFLLLIVFADLFWQTLIGLQTTINKVIGFSFLGCAVFQFYAVLAKM
jgi:threonine/homoserine/homoserine lactone efflux protein